AAARGLTHRTQNLGWQGRARRSLRRDFRAGSRRAELSGVDTIALHLDVQGLVVDPEESRRLALVPQRGLKGQPDRLPLRLGDCSAGDLPQGGALLSSLSTVRSRHFREPPPFGRLATRERPSRGVGRSPTLDRYAALYENSVLVAV